MGENIKERVIAGNLRFEVVCNRYFHNYLIRRSVVLATVKWVW